MIINIMAIFRSLILRIHLEMPTASVSCCFSFHVCWLNKPLLTFMMQQTSAKEINCAAL